MTGSRTVGLPEEGPVRRAAHTVGPDERDMELWGNTVFPSGRAVPVCAGGPCGGSPDGGYSDEGRPTVVAPCVGNDLGG